MANVKVKAIVDGDGNEVFQTTNDAGIASFQLNVARQGGDVRIRVSDLSVFCIVLYFCYIREEK